MGAEKDWSREETVLAFKTYVSRGKDLRRCRGKKEDVFVS